MLSTAAQQIAYIKAKAGSWIVAHFPPHSQDNAHARALLLIRKELTQTLSESEGAEMARIETLWAWVESVRSLSDTLEAQVIGGTPVEMSTVEWPAFPA